ncbi:MAG: FHA domain-containing protein [Deltaproteobacteria bacterium]|nr:FHA domain-containing protein [Deltaproteobacteria bacterium]
MIPGFGKQVLTIGSAQGCDIVLAGPGVAPEHARLEHHGGGKLLFTNLHAGASTVDGRPLGAGEQAAFDFRAQFHAGGLPVPFDHPAIALSLMAAGTQTAPVGQFHIGRDPGRASLVLQHPSVSSMHASVALDRMMVTDHSSTSGTYVGGQRIPAGTPVPLPPQGAIHFGPVPLQVGLLVQLAEAARAQAALAAQPQPLPLPGPQPVPGPQPQPQPLPLPGQPGPQPQPGAAAVLAAGAPGAAPAGSAPAGATPMKKHKTVFGQLDFGQAQSGVKTIGRTEGNAIIIPHPQVSSRHAQVHSVGGKLYIEDLGSANGTYVRGARIPPGQRVEIGGREKIYVGPMPLQLDVTASGAVEVVHEEYGLERWAGRPLYEIEAWSLFLEVPDRDDRSKTKVLLDNISFKALPGDMIALMGPSGAGKTTLLLALNGYLPPTTGLVRINGEDLYSIYDTLRGSIGYVPQDDLVHPELTVFEAVRYSAKFRLPPDYSAAEIDGRVMQTLTDLGLEGVAHLQIGKPERKILSGGQRKRVNIALELVTDPVILYLDEPTSGLASDDAAGLIRLLAELTKATGKTIIMTVHQPAKDEYEKFNQAIVLGYGGVPMYFGPTRPDSYQFFSRWAELARQTGGAHANIERAVEQLPVDNPRDMFALITEREKPIFQALVARDPNAQRGEARYQAALQWRQEYYNDANPTYARMYSGRRAVGTGEGQRGIPERRPAMRGQFGLLLSRYFKTKWRDVSGTLIMCAQAPIIGVLVAVVFGGQRDEVPAWCLGALRELASRVGQGASDKSIFEGLQLTKDQTGAAFFLVVSAIWFGTSNAAREIVRERAIYLRERMVNLGLLSYVMSKFVLLAMFCIVQCAMLLAIVFFSLGFHGGPQAFLTELGALAVTSVSAAALGLLLSTLVTSSEAAMALTPIALIPQVVLGGLMVPMTTIPHLSWLMYVIPARWGFEACVRPERLAVADDPSWLIDLHSDKTAATDFVFQGKFQCAMAQMASDSFNGAWGFATHEQLWIPYAVLGTMTVATLIAICVILRRRDPV